MAKRSRPTKLEVRVAFAEAANYRERLRRVMALLLRPVGNQTDDKDKGNDR